MEFTLGILVASLAGSPHCAAMCGPFLAFAAAGGDTPPAARRSSPLLAYHGGRLVSYLLLGVAAGALGAGVEQLGRLAGLARSAALVSGLLMVAWGAHTMFEHTGRASRLHGPAWVRKALGAVVARVGGMSGPMRGGITGLATALLPCGWLYVFVAAAGGTASPARGALVMLVFWSGTVPAMTALGLGLQRLAGPARRHLPLVTAAVVVAIGLFTIAGRLRPDIGRTPVSVHVHDGSR
jgi:sulfite exporter TauE/SafE